MKYYFICYHEYSYGHFYNELIDIHPLQWQINQRLKSSKSLVSWHEISVDEYNEYQLKFNN